MQNKTNNRNCIIDICKYIAALLIIGIHTAVFSDIHEGLYFLVVQVICRMAVPFFAMCSGYFLAIKPQSMFVQWKKILLLYGIWTMLYLIYSIPSWIRLNWFGTWVFVDYGIGAILKGSHYHLWYLLGLLYALPILYICFEKISYKFYVWMAVILYFIKVLIYGYRSYLPECLLYIVEVLDKFNGISDAVFCILPFLLLGAYVFRRGRNNSRFSVIGLLLSFVALIIEAKALSMTGQTTVSYIMLTLPTAFFLFKSIVNFKIKVKELDSRNLGEISLLVYCVHPMIVETLENVVANSILNFVLTSVLSTAVALVVIIIKRKISDKH